MVDVRRLKMLQMVQLFKCEEDASQVSEPQYVSKPEAGFLSRVFLPIVSNLFFKLGKRNWCKYIRPDGLKKTAY